MLGDEERSSTYAAEQRRLVRASLAAEVLTFTPYWRDVAVETGLALPKSVADLQALAPRPLHALGPPDSLVLRPSPEAVRKSGPRPLRRRLRRARLRRSKAMRGILDPLYKPIHWIIENGTPVGCTEADLLRLAEIGSRSLELAGVTPSDAIVGLVPPGPSLATWQLALGAREAGIPLAGLAPDTSLEAIAMLGPTVLAGGPGELLRVLRGLDDAIRSDVVSILAVAREPLAARDRRALAAAAGGRASVIEVWSPPGVRSLWTQCRGGDGVHTWPQAELIEVCGPDDKPVAPGEEGQLVWTGLGWRGTVLVRLATGMLGRLVEGTCETCGRTTPRVLDSRPLAELIGDASGARKREGLVQVAEPDEDVEPVERVLGPVKATGGVESVRIVRTPRKARATTRAAAAEVSPAADAVPDEPPGTVRAVLKEPSASSPPLPPRARSSIGEVADLPPQPEVGPDAAVGGGGDEQLDPWLPDTGEVDAWPAPVLASTEGLAAWQVEHRRRRGHDELVVHLALDEGAELGEVLVALERSIGATQYVLSSADEINARVADADGRRVVDRRRGDRQGRGNGDRRSKGSMTGGGNLGGNGDARSAIPERRSIRKR